MSDKSNLDYDKLAKISLLVNEIRSRCKSSWNCAKFVIVVSLQIGYPYSK